MKAKPILTAVLLLFVAATAVALVVKEARNGSVSDAASAHDEAIPLPDNGLVAFYFHGNTRCPTCRSIEAQAHDLVAADFADPLTDGRLVWQTVNYETPGYEHFVDDYQLVAPVVVLSVRRDGKEAAWRSLDRVWELVGDETAFAEYVREEVKDMLADQEPATPSGDSADTVEVSPLGV